MDQVCIVTQGVSELYFMRMSNPEDPDEDNYEETLVRRENVIGVFNDAPAAIQCMVEKSKERVKWMQEQHQPYLTKEVNSWDVRVDQPVYYAVLLAGTEFMYGEYLKFEIHDVT